MALFDLSGIVSDLNTVIAGLDLPNEEEQRLAVLIKAAVNLGENPSTIIGEIQDRVEAINDTVLLEKFAVLVGALSVGTNDRIVSLAAVDDLPNLYTTDSTPNGSIFFVDSIGVLVVSVGNKWLGLDGRLLRNDAPVIDAMNWGAGGTLGDGERINRSSPTTIVGGITNWSSISAGSNHSLGLTDAGIAYAWGCGVSGQLGEGIPNNRSSPVTVVGGITNWCAVSGGNGFSLGLTQNGIAYAWGCDGDGRLGISDGSLFRRSSPVTVVGGITNWSSISAGINNSLGLTDTGIAYGWGRNFYGDVGDGTRTARSSPVTVIGGITNWCAISAGRYFGLGLTQDGIAYGWGNSDWGQLGNGQGGTFKHRSSPVTVVGGITNWCAIAAGSRLGLGITSAGVLYSWGRNSSGGLGDNSIVNRSSPVTVVGGITNWCAASAGERWALGLTDTGELYSWGYRFFGRLGDGFQIDRSSPVTVAGGITSWSAIDAGGAHGVALKTR